jgi:ABC-2 type transport system permease protein
VNQAHQEFAGTAQINFSTMEFTHRREWLVGFLVYFIGGYFLYSSFMLQLKAAVDNQNRICNNFLLPIIMPHAKRICRFFLVLLMIHTVQSLLFFSHPPTSPVGGARKTHKDTDNFLCHGRR